jgi:ABC-type branched-subunit amino acid transport system ATPase component
LAAEADDIIDRFGLAAYAGLPSDRLSTGTRRICDLAAQAATRPRLMILDEPTSGVAQRETEAFRPLIRDLAEELGCGMLVVEHDMPFLMTVADRIYCLERGRVIAEGTPAAVRKDPAVVASYLGVPGPHRVGKARPGRRGAPAKAPKPAP